MIRFNQIVVWTAAALCQFFCTLSFSFVKFTNICVCKAFKLFCNGPQFDVSVKGLLFIVQELLFGLEALLNHIVCRPKLVLGFFFAGKCLQCDAIYEV